VTDSTRRLAVVSQQYPPDKSGHASRISDTATALAERGWDVEVVAPPPSFPHGEFDRDWYRTRRTVEDGVAVRRLWAWQPTEADPGTISRLAYYVTFALHAFLWLTIGRRRYDIVLTTTPPISTGLPGFVAALSDIPWVVDVRDLWIDASVSLGFIPEGGVLERGSRRFQRRVLHTADAVAVTTETLGEHLCDQYEGALGEKLLHVPNGVDIDRFAAAKAGGGADADRATTLVGRSGGADGAGSTDRGRPVIIYVGNIGHAQALDTCVRAMERLEHDATFRLVGGGDAVPDLRRVAAEAGVAGRVEFTGPVPNEEAPSLLAAADVGVAPLLDDAELAYAMPTKVYEYMGAGLPVVTTGRGELERFVDRSGGGIHTATDPDAVADALDTLLADEGYRRRVGAAGREYIRPTYDRDYIAVRLSDHLQRLVEERGGRSGGDATRHRNVAEAGTSARLNRDSENSGVTGGKGTRERG